MQKTQHLLGSKKIHKDPAITVSPVLDVNPCLSLVLVYSNELFCKLFIKF